MKRGTKRKKKVLVGWLYESEFFIKWSGNSSLFKDETIKIPYIYRNKHYAKHYGGNTEKDKLKKYRITIEEAGR